MPQLPINENTKIISSISALVSVIGFAIFATFTFTTWKAETEHKLLAMEQNIKDLKIENDKMHTQIDKEMQIFKVESKKNATSMTEIKADLKWIIALLQEKEDK